MRQYFTRSLNTSFMFPKGIMLYFAFIFLGYTANSQSLDSITFYLKWDHQFEFAGYYAAVEQGYFKEVGLHVTDEPLKSFDSQLDAIEGFVGRYGISNSNLFIEFLKGRKVVMISPIFQHSPVVLYTHKRDNILHPQDLKGKTLVTANTLYPELFVMMKREGIDPSSTNLDSVWIYSKFSSGEAHAILQLSIDIGYSDNPESIRMLHPVEYGVDFYGELVYTSQKEMEENPERAKSFREALIKGWDYALAHPNEVIELIRRKYRPDLDTAPLVREYEEVVKLMEPDIVPVGHNNRGRWEKMQADLFKYSAITEQKSLTGFFYEDYLTDDNDKLTQIISWIALLLGVFAIFLVAQWIINRRLNSLLSARMKEINSHNEELKKMNSELDNFVYRVSHDLRAPISSSLGLLNLIERESYGDFEEYHQLIRKSLLKLDDFIIDILHYSRNSRLEIDEKPVGIEELVNEVIESVGHPSSKIRIEKTISGDAAFPTDKGRLTIILNNLIANAFRYGDLQKEDPYIKVDVECDEVHLKITVSDNGIGIEEEHIPKVFDMFYRAHHERTGSGLGLYIVQEVIEKLNGTIHLESQIEVGTTVTVNIYNKESLRK